MSQKKTTLEVHVQPGAGSNVVSGDGDGVLHVKMSAPPRKGQANRALITLLADAAGVAKSEVQIIRGHTGRRKVVALQGLDASELKKRLARAVPVK